jgi:hypothetical protein
MTLKSAYGNHTLFLPAVQAVFIVAAAKIKFILFLIALSAPLPRREAGPSALSILRDPSARRPLRSSKLPRNGWAPE